eukprot:TRINITY_DN5193_c1_g1_i5.p1 TRINITY_DN5193_c1_g1~~TRINITY_DN5193_c1_g1_i5.p1  ORF type:complete len:228 (+),score=-25.38 TRINITY_DN5193_c1_g1_i5:226-909(+)
MLYNKANIWMQIYVKLSLLRSTFSCPIKLKNRSLPIKLFCQKTQPGKLEEKIQKFQGVAIFFQHTKFINQYYQTSYLLQNSPSYWDRIRSDIPNKNCQTYPFKIILQQNLIVINKRDRLTYLSLTLVIQLYIININFSCRYLLWGLIKDCLQIRVGAQADFFCWEYSLTLRKNLEYQYSNKNKIFLYEHAQSLFMFRFLANKYFWTSCRTSQSTKNLKLTPFFIHVL